MAAQALSVVSISPSVSPSSHRASCDASKSLPWSLKPSTLPAPFLGTKLSIRPPNPFHFSTKPRTVTNSALLNLPTKKERALTEKKPSWSARAIKAFGMAELNARKLKYPETGTESLLAGILIEGSNVAANFLRADGITVNKVRLETVNLLGKSEMMFNTPVYPPLTEQAQRALDWAVDEKLKSGESGEITTVHMLLGIWAQEDSAGHKILSALGFNDEKAKELAKSMNQDNIFTIRMEKKLE